MTMLQIPVFQSLTSFFQTLQTTTATSHRLFAALRNRNLLRSLLRARLGERHSQHPILHRRLDLLRLQKTTTRQHFPSIKPRSKTLTYLDTLRQRHAPRELAIPSLPHSVPILVSVRRHLRLPRNGEHVVVHVDVDVFFGEARELEGGCDGVGLGVFVYVDPTYKKP